MPDPDPLVERTAIPGELLPPLPDSAYPPGATDLAAVNLSDVIHQQARKDGVSLAEWQLVNLTTVCSRLLAAAVATIEADRDRYKAKVARVEAEVAGWGPGPWRDILRAALDGREAPDD